MINPSRRTIPASGLRPRSSCAGLIPAAANSAGRPICFSPSTVATSQNSATRSASSVVSTLWRSKRWALSHPRSEEHTSELQSRGHLVCRLLLEKKKKKKQGTRTKYRHQETENRYKWHTYY